MVWYGFIDVQRDSFCTILQKIFVRDIIRYHSSRQPSNQVQFYTEQHFLDFMNDFFRYHSIERSVRSSRCEKKELDKKKTNKTNKSNSTFCQLKQDYYFSCNLYSSFWLMVYLLFHELMNVITTLNKFFIIKLI